MFVCVLFVVVCLCLFLCLFCFRMIWTEREFSHRSDDALNSFVRESVCLLIEVVFTDVSNIRSMI